MSAQIIKQFYCKAKNRRVWVELYYFKEDGKYLFKINIKTLNTGRDIYKTENWYSPETFVLLRDLINSFLDTQILSTVYPERLKAVVYEYDKVKKHINEITNKL